MRFLAMHSAATVCYLALVLPWGGSVTAAPAPAFSELLQQADKTAPRLIESAALLDAATARVRQAAAWPNPEFGVEVENFGGTGPYRGSSQAQTTFSLSEPLELGGQRGARLRATRADLVASQARAMQLRADFAYELALAYANGEAMQKRAALLTNDLSRSEEDVRRTRALVSAGREGELRALQAETAAAGARADLESARSDVAESFARLSSLVGTPNTYDGVASSLLARANGVLSAPALSPQRAPAIAAAEADSLAAAGRLQVERKRRLPTVALSVGARRFAGEQATAMVGGVSVALPLFDWNRGGIAAARAEQAAADARLAGVRLDASANWNAATARVVAANARLQAASQGEAAARDAYSLTRIGYEAGRASLLELLSTRRALTDAELRALDARVAWISIQATIARLQGQMPFGEASE